MEAQAPSRKLTTHQQAVLIQVLLAFPEQRVGVEHCDWADAPSYARDFLTIFNAVRWDVGNWALGKKRARVRAVWRLCFAEKMCRLLLRRCGMRCGSMRLKWR